MDDLQLSPRSARLRSCTKSSKSNRIEILFKGDQKVGIRTLQVRLAENKWTDNTENIVSVSHYQLLSIIIVFTLKTKTLYNFADDLFPFF